jgi:hypothetical protein
MLKFVSVVALAACANVASAALVKLDSSAYSNGSGGEFTATPSAGFLGLTGLFADLSPDTFQTFCMERSEQFQPGQTYTGVVNTGAVLGSEPMGFDLIDDRTAFLYTNFRLGTLVGYDYGAGRTASAGDLQNAIWFIEGEGGANNAFVALADAAVLSAAWTGLGNVRVINLYDDAGGLHQDQLTLIPTPGAFALMGVAGLIVARRRR